MYHLIDEKRRLYACNVAEITLEDAYCILQSWGGKHSLSEVVVFYSATQNAVVTVSYTHLTLPTKLEV